MDPIGLMGLISPLGSIGSIGFISPSLFFGKKILGDLE